MGGFKKQVWENKCGAVCVLKLIMVSRALHNEVHLHKNLYCLLCWLSGEHISDHLLVTAWIKNSMFAIFFAVFFFFKKTFHL